MSFIGKRFYVSLTSKMKNEINFPNGKDFTKVLVNGMILSGGKCNSIYLHYLWEFCRCLLIVYSKKVALNDVVC